MELHLKENRISPAFRGGRAEPRPWTLALAGAIALMPSPLKAQIISDEIIPDATLGPAASQVSPTRDFRSFIEGGRLQGENLFHSFQEFNIDLGQSVYFSQPADVENILTRVTGNNVSHVLGTLGVLGAANLFFLNPNGIVFGPEARLDIQGAFTASTAPGFEWSGGVVFSAVDPSPPPMLTLNLVPGLQSGQSGAEGRIHQLGQLAAGQDLTLSASHLDLRGQLRAGQDLTLMAQESVRIRDQEGQAFRAIAGGDLLIEGGQVDIFALNHPRSGFFSDGNMILRSAHGLNGDAHYWAGGQFRIEQSNGLPGGWSSQDDPIIRSLGDVSFSTYAGASLHILAGGQVDADLIIITEPGGQNSTINPTTTPVLANITLSDGTSLGVDGSARATLDIRAGLRPEAVGLPLGTEGVGGSDLFLEPIPGSDSRFSRVAPPLQNVMVSSADINIGEISINDVNGLTLLTNQYESNPALLPGNITLENGNLEGGRRGAVIIDAAGLTTLRNTLVTSGDIRVVTGSLAVLEGGGLRVRAIREDESGDINIIARDAVRFAGEGPRGSSFAVNRVEPDRVANSGDINISAHSLALTDGALLSVSNQGIGTSGNIRIDVQDKVIFSGEDQDGFSSAALSQLRLGAMGQAGEISIRARALELINGAEISTTTFSQGNAGQIAIDVEDGILITGETRRGLTSGIFSLVDRRANGDAGDISLHARTLDVVDGGQISTSTSGQGEAGEIRIRAQESVFLEGRSRFFGPGGIGTEVDPGAIGNAGNIDLVTQRLTIENGAAILANTEGQGMAGNLQIVAEELELNMGGQISTTTASDFDAGEIRVDAGSLDLLNPGSGIFASTESEAGGQGGRLLVNSDRLVIQDQAQISVDSDGTGIGGELQLSTGLLALNHASISAQTQSSQGGNLRVAVDDTLLLQQGSQISTNAGQAGAGGDGGNIQIGAQFVLAIPGEDSNITANAFEGRGGNISITAQGIYNLEFQTEELPIRNDITASSELGTDGLVELNTSGLEPTQGTVALPSDVRSPQISQSCQLSPGTSRFVATGPGGLPLGPRDRVAEPRLWETLDLPTELSDARETPSELSMAESVVQRTVSEQGGPVELTREPLLTEAQGWKTLGNGKIQLIVSVPLGLTSSPYTHCSGETS